MDIVWGEIEGKPEGATEYSEAAVKASRGDTIFVNPPKSFSGRTTPKVKGKWVELHPTLRPKTVRPQFWANPKIKFPVGHISGFELDLGLHLANIGISNVFTKVEQPGNIAFINGPNLNTLGTHETEIYGNKTLETIFNECKIIAPNCNFVFRQSNSEGEIVTLIQKLRMESDAIIINAGGYTHTSVAIHDALKLYDDQIIELHVTNPWQREEFRHTNYISSVADSIIAGFGPNGYKLALIAACMRL